MSDAITYTEDVEVIKRLEEYIAECESDVHKDRLSCVLDTVKYLQQVEVLSNAYRRIIGDIEFSKNRLDDDKLQALCLVAKEIDELMCTFGIVFNRQVPMVPTENKEKKGLLSRLFG